METAQSIAQMYAPDLWKDLERAILRHMEHHVTITAQVELERCATIAETFADQAIKDRDGFGASYCNDIAAAIRIVANKKE